MKKLYLMAVAAFSFAAGQSHAQVTWGAGGSIGANAATTNLNVGISNTAPILRMHLKTASTNDGIMVSQTSSTAASLNLEASTGRRWALFSTGSGNFEGAGNFGIYDYNSASYRVFITGSTGNVGINTTQTIGIAAPSHPQHKLQVHNGNIMISGTSAGFGGPMILFSDNVASTAYPNGHWGIEYIPSSGLNFWQPWNPGPGGGGNYFMFLKDDGKVGIGIDPTIANSYPNGYKLYVKDGILTEKLKVALFGTANWADYVFEPGYELKSLEEVEAFVKKNKHLPGVPSAQQLVDEGGIDMNKMFAKQMEKIEELTLYVIELKKENKELLRMIGKQKK